MRTLFLLPLLLSTTLLALPGHAQPRAEATPRPIAARGALGAEEQNLSLIHI